MDLATRLSNLEGYRDWQGLVDELEKGLAQAPDAQAKAALHLQLGRVLAGKFLQGAKALKHFQDAFKQDAKLVEALSEARGVYWTLGKLNMVQKLLELELKQVGDGPAAAPLLLELGGVLSDAGDYDRAAATYARALSVSGGAMPEASALLEDTQLDESTWRAHVTRLLAGANGGGSTASRALVRAARITRRFAPAEVEALLERAYAADPSDREAAALYEGMLLEAKRPDDIAAAQARVLASLEGHAKAAAALNFGVRWAIRHQDTERATKFLEQSYMAEPSEPAFAFLRESYGSRDGNWERVAALAENGATRATAGIAAYLQSQAGDVLWRHVGNLIRARQAFAHLATIAPDHPAIKSFELQIGEPVTATSSGFPVASRAGSIPPPASIAPAAMGSIAPASTTNASSVAPSHTPLAASPASVAPAAADAPASVAPGSSATPSVAQPTPRSTESVHLAGGEAQIAELRALATKQESAKRYNEYVKTLVQLSGIVTDPGEKIDLLLRAAELYVGKFANQTKAVEVYEQVLELDPEHAASVSFLRTAYEKRLAWEKLLGLERREASKMPMGPERSRRLVEMARLASERVKKPELNIELWRDVLDDDPDSAEALANLGALYERQKDFAALVGVLERQVDLTPDNAARVQIYAKLGTFYGDRLNDDEGAVSAWRRLLALDANDRRAQEAIKKKYLALGRWEDLEVFYAESGKWDEFIRVLESQEAKETAPEAKIGLLMKSAQLWADKKQRADRAARGYERVLELDTQNLAAAEALIPIYGQAQNAKGLASAIEVKLGHETEDEGRLGLLREVSQIYETRLKDAGRAFERALSAFAIAPGDDASRADVERLARATGRWDDVIDAYRGAVTRAEGERDRELAARLRLALGRVLVDEAKRVDDALAEFRAVYEDDGDNSEALAALERLYRQTGRFRELLPIYERKRDLAASWQDRRETAYAIARLYENELSDEAAAVTAYRAVLDEDPADATALGALDGLYQRLGQWEPYVDVLRKRIELESDESAIVELKYRLGQALENRLDQPTDALENYREILFLDQGHEGARRALEGLVAKKGDLAPEAAAILEPIYELSGDSEKLIGVLEILAGAEADPRRRVGLLRKISRAAATQGDVTLAIDASARALRDEPSDAETLAELESYASQANAWGAVGDVYRAIARDTSDARLGRDYGLRVARIDEYLGHVDKAAAAYAAVLALDPSDAEALAAMDALYRRTERWDDLIGVYRRRVELATEPTEREGLYGQIASIYDEKLSKPAQAIAAYREMLAEDDTSETALRALETLFTRQGLWPDLADNLEAQLRLAPTEREQIALMLRLADVREREMGEVDQAIEIHRQVLERDPDETAALEALERLGTDPRHELAIAETLEPLYRRVGNFQRLIGVYEVQARRSDDPARKVELLHQVAQLHEDGAGDTNAAFDTMARAMEIEPANDTTASGLDRLARATSRFADLARTFESLGAAHESDSTLAADLYTASARIYQDDIGDVDAAVGLYRRVLALEPTSLDAATSLERLFRRAERYPDLSLALQRKAEIVDDAVERKAALFQAASIEEDVLGRREAAIVVYQKVLDIDPDENKAIDALVNLYLALGRWEELLATYQRKVDLVADPDEKKAIFYQVGAVFEREIGDVPRAIDTYRRVLEIDPDDLVALGRLDALYQAASDWPELLSVLQREAEMAADPEEGIAFQYRIAELYETRLNDVARAVELYRDVLQQQPDHAPTLRSLEAIKAGESEPLAAALVLEPVYESLGDWSRLISVLEVQARAESDKYARVELLHRIARLYEDSMGDMRASFDAYARSLSIDNANDETLAALERLAMATERWPEVARLYDVELDRLTDEPERHVELGLRVAHIYEDRLDDVDAAVARYERVAGVDAENVAALRALDRLFTRSQRWRELADVLGREAAIAQNPDEIFELRFRLGQLAQSRLGDLDAAIAAYRDILAASPDHVPALEALEGLFASGERRHDIGAVLEPLYEASGDWNKLAGVYEAQLSQITEPTDRLAAYYRLAELSEERMLDPSAALEIYVRALREQPLDEKAGEEAERLAGMADAGWERLANAYADVTGETEDAAVKIAIGKRLARVFEDELADVANAEETYRYVLSVNPTDEDALANLDRICTAQEKWADLAAVLEQRAIVARETNDKVELYARLGEVYETRLEQPDDAIRAQRAIFDELEPRSEGAIAALGRLYAQRGAYRELLGVHERELDNAVGDTAEADIRARMATLLAGELGDPTRATTEWKRVLDLRGEDQEALAALADLYERGGLWAELTDVLDRQEAVAMNDEARVEALTRRARTFSEKLGRDDEALTDWNRVLDVDYSHLEALRAIARIRRTQNDPVELAAALQQTVDRATPALEPHEVRAIYRELAKTHGEALQQPFEAAEAWTRLLEVDPTDFEALDALEVIYRADERWHDVVVVKMGRASALTEPEAKIAELLEIAAIWENEIADRDGGREAYEHVLAIEPAHDRAFHALEELHTAAGRWEPLVELYLNWLDTLTDIPAKSDILRRIARVFDEHLNDKEQAYEALVNAFADDYSDDETVRYLERITQATGRWGQLIQTANEWLKAQAEPRARIALSLRIAKWYGEDLGRPEYAQPYFAQVVQLEPNNVGVMRQLGSLYRKNGQWQQVGEMLTKALDASATDKDRKEILTELGDLVNGQFKNPDQALGYYGRALDVDPHYVPAIESLEKIYVERGQHQDLVRVLGQKVPALTDPEQIAATKLRIGSTYETSLSQPEEAARFYAEALEAEPTNLAAMRGLERVYGVLGRSTDLLGVLEAQLDVVSSERERIDVLYKIAALQENESLRSDLQAMRLEQIIEIDPSQEPALEGLARAYTRLRQWRDLINTYERHVNATIDRAKKVELYSRIAQIFADELDDVDQAVDAYHNVIELDDTNVPALDALSKLYEKRGDVAQAIDFMTRVADLTGDGRQRVEMYYRIGRALDEKLGDRVAAQERYEMALDLDPAHVPALAALRQIALDSADWDRAARYLDQEQLNTPAPRARARLLVELGRLRDETLGEHELAVQAYELALQADPENEDAALPLLDEYAARERWVEAEPLAELLVRKSSKRERAEQHRLQKTVGRIADALGKDERALKAYQAALQLDVTDQETIRGLAEVNFRLHDWPGALTNFQKVLTALGEDENEPRADVYYKLGRIKREQGQARQGIGFFQKALALVPGHRPTLEALVDVYSEAKDWKQVAEYKRQILDNVVDDEERYQLLGQIADVWADGDKNYAKATDALEEARELRPDEHRILHRLLALYEKAQNWGKVIETIQAISEMETNPERKSRYLYTLAQLYRDKENDLVRAVELFNAALDLNPALLEAFERINKILTAQKDWKSLERAFRSMLKRINNKGNTELEYNLLHNLGLIYRDRMNAPDLAIEAFKLAKDKRPDEAIENLILAELYETTDRADLAIGEQQEILAKDPARVEPYRALFRLYQQTGAYDPAWCVSAALALLRKAEPDEQSFYETYKPQGMLQPKSRMTNELWARSLFHDNANIYIGKIFEMLSGAALLAKIDDLKRQNKLPQLDPRFRQDPATSTVTFAKTFGWAASVLDINNMPQLYVRADVQGGLATVPGQPPAVIAGQSVLTGFQPQELTFICGEHLALFRGEFFIKNLFPTQTELEVLLYAGIALARPDFALPADKQAQVAPVAKALAAKMQPMHIEGLRQAVKGFFEQGAKVNLKRWLQGVDATAARAGLVLCGDLEIARKIISAKPQLPGELSPSERMRDLLVFSVSAKYFALRKALGIAIG